MGHQIYPKEVQSIVRRLDIDGDNKITFSEFYEALQLISIQNPESNRINAKNNEIRNIKINTNEPIFYSKESEEELEEASTPYLPNSNAHFED